MQHLIFPSCLAVAALSGCGGASTGAVPFGGLNVSVGGGVGVSTVAGAPDVRRVALSVANSNTVFNAGVSRDPSRDVPLFDAFSSDTSGVLLFEAVGDSGTVHVAAKADDDATGVQVGANADSRGGTLPQSGTASYVGAYAGFLTRGPATSIPNLTQSYISGTLNLTANFRTGTVSGAITDRQRYRTSTTNLLGTMGDVTLGALTVSGGASDDDGVTSGGGIEGAAYVPAGPLRGVWDLGLGGDGAAEAGGTVQIIHDYRNTEPGDTPDDYVEIGGFAAARN